MTLYERSYVRRMVESAGLNLRRDLDRVYCYIIDRGMNYEDAIALAAERKRRDEPPGAEFRRAENARIAETRMRRGL